ncbi:hypothetical protein BGZ60DRAFT_534900 [Tricladium varicosporioides]|nr:hypothetical protein BGZ60DRAFT_534900 [Hymenoscyphus varicosporioides]
MSLKLPNLNQTITDINTLSTFLSHAQFNSSQLATHTPVDAIVICVSAVFHSAEVLFHTLSSHPSLTKILVLCGGIGHSTPLIYEAVKNHSKFSPLYNEIMGLPEARVLEVIMEKFFDGLGEFRKAGGRVLVEYQSTNCGANASCTRALLEINRVEKLETVIVVQDPTMSLRTVASFQKVYADLPSPPTFIGCPLLVPEVELGSDGGMVFKINEHGEGVELSRKEMWDIARFCDLIMGEVPRLRDDEQGYGPRGKGFIAHVDIPEEVEKAWGRLSGDLESRR